MTISEYRGAPSALDSSDTISRLCLDTDGTILLKIYSSIVQSILPGISQKVIIIIDDLTILELIGVPTVTLTRFVRALHALCLTSSASLIIRARALSSPVTGVPFETEFLRYLLNCCHVHVEVRPLASGRSSAVSGEISVHNGGLFSDDCAVAMGRRFSMQYRLNDAGAVLFQKGIGAGVLLGGRIWGELDHIA